MSPAPPSPRETFETLLEPHLDRLWRLAMRLAHDKTEAEDLFQDVLVKTFVGLDKLAGIRDRGPWLCRVMYNQFIDRQRAGKRRRLKSVDLETLQGGDGLESLPGNLDPVADAERRDELKRIDTALQILSDNHRLVILLHDVEGYKLEEIHDMTGDPVGTIKSRLHRARARLREFLAEDGTKSVAPACRKVTGCKT